MTKKELKWRLSDLPDATDVASLVEQEVITKEEAREILFNEVTPSKDNKRVKELEEEVKFLRELCDKLSAKSNWSNIYHYYETYKPSYPRWYKQYEVIMNAVPTVYNLSTGVSSLSNNISGAQNSNMLSVGSSSSTATRPTFSSLN